jgi:TetR/AcrR family transcriptional regulator
VAVPFSGKPTNPSAAALLYNGDIPGTVGAWRYRTTGHEMGIRQEALGKDMPSERRRGAASSATRTELIGAATALIREEGYAALTSRTLADRLGLSRQIVHYYFKSMDDLCIALVQEGAVVTLKRLEDAIQSAEPLRAVWDLCNDPEQAALSLELIALARRRPAVRAEVRKLAERFREIQTQALVKDLERRGIQPSIKPIVASILLSGLSQVMALEEAIDLKMGHAETLELVDACLVAFNDSAAPARIVQPLLQPRPRARKNSGPPVTVSRKRRRPGSGRAN